MIGQMLSHYRVVEQIGAGGMGVVYRAHDEQLDRDVALKVLPPGTIADEAARSRFRKEALALAKLDHPNIATIFEFGSQDGVDFLVAAYIPGLTLDAKLASRALSPDEVLALGVQIAKGLTAAHEKGIVHRDLKPGNLRLTPDGLLKILDFGLAQFVDTGPDAETLTRTHSQETTGTLPYMAPEQVRAEPVDARTDIWALGAVLYEMSTGVRPFREKQPAALINAILNTQAKSPQELNSQVSPGLENIILKALDKNPAHRYQSARELGIDLERLQSGTAPLGQPHKKSNILVWTAVGTLLALMALAGFLFLRKSEGAGKARRSVAVLGFKNLSGKPEEAWVSTALSEMLTTELGAGGQLRTIPGETVSRMKADLELPESDSLANDTLSKVYKVLGSDVIVLGSYLEIGGQIRVNFRVQDASGETIATESEQGTQSQFFDLIKRVGGTLREKCGARELTADEMEATRASEPTNTEAARYYAEGLARLRQFDAQAARDSFQLAVKADPNHALAHSALAAAWSQLGYDQNAIDASKKAFDLSEKLPRGEKLSIEARYREMNHEWSKAAEIYRSLWTFFPDDLDYGLRLVEAQVSAGQGQQALQTVQALHQLPAPSRDDPRIDLAEASAAESLSDFKQEVAATTRARTKAGGQGSQFLVAQALLDQCWAQRNLGELEQAKAAGEQAQAILSAARDRRGEANSLTCVANVLADQGKLDDAKIKHEQALALARQIGAQKDIAGALINLGNIAAQRNLQESTANYQEALSVATNVQDKTDILTAQNNLAANLIADAEFPAAAKMLDDAIATADNSNNQANSVLARINLASVEISLGQLADARQHLDAALGTARQLNLKSSIAATLEWMGDLSVIEDAFEQAGQNYQQSLNIRSEIGERGGIATIWFSMAALEIERKNLTKAADLAQQAIEEFHNQHNDDQEAISRCFLARTEILRDEVKAAQQQIDLVRQLKVQDKTISLVIEITEAKLKAAGLQIGPARVQLDTVVKQSRQMKLPGYEFEARLEKGQLVRPRKDVAGLRALAKEADSKGFKLIARKAREVAVRQ
jgi:serine/threonine protein kinase/tetratricopeptide (TPR) repeat protein